MVIKIDQIIPSNTKNKLTIIMYHYVRKIKGSSFPNIKGLEIFEFENQILYLKEHYRILDPDEFYHYSKDSNIFPNNSCILTFDDGLKDHYDNVLPILQKNEIRAFFFPSSKPTFQNIILPVQGIHLLLSKFNNIEILLREVKDFCVKVGYSDNQISNFFNSKIVRGRWDSSEIYLFKRLLQHILPINLSDEILKYLINKYLKIDLLELNRYMYMDIQNIKTLHEQGMEIGSHGHSHYWLGNLNYHSQLEDINESLNLFEEIGKKMNQWTMCYPYGSYNEDTLNILNKKKCAFGFTTKSEVCDFSNINRLCLPRLDTNDFLK